MALPMSVQHSATSQELGEFVKRHPGAFVKPILGTIVFCIIVCAAAVFYVPIFQQDSQIPAWGYILAVVVFIGIIALNINDIIKTARKKVYLFQRGLIIVNKGQIQAFPWNQTTDFSRKVTRHYRIYGGFIPIYEGSEHKYSLRRADGCWIELDNRTRGIAKLGKAIAQGVSQEQLPRIWGSIQAGQTVTFGKFSINMLGIDNGRGLIPWQEVKDVKVRKGQVTIVPIKRANRSFSNSPIAVADISNYFVFIVIAQEMIQQAKGSQLEKGLRK